MISVLMYLGNTILRHSSEVKISELEAIETEINNLYEGGEDE